MPSAPAFERIAAAPEVSIETSSGDRAFHTVVWVVAVDDKLYVRSFLGDGAKWYRRVETNPRVALTFGPDRLEFTAVRVTDVKVIESVSGAFVEKYPKGRSLDAMVRDEVLDTTLILEPRRLR